MSISQAYLKEILDYCPISGKFTWKRACKGTAAGDTAGSLCGRNMAHIRIVIDKRPYYAHRLAWLWVNGEMPSTQIDHIDRDGLNNSISNLRLATCSQNLANRAGRVKSANIYKGAYQSGGRWLAQITIAGKTKNLGSFRNPEDAAKAYDAAAQAAYGEYALTNSALGYL